MNMGHLFWAYYADFVVQPKRLILERLVGQFE